eukprot:2852045-Pyramimonas_sp.AAC.1
MSGVSPSLLCVLTSAPPSSSAATAASCPPPHARAKGVSPSALFRSTAAPLARIVCKKGVGRGFVDQV